MAITAQPIAEPFVPSEMTAMRLHAYGGPEVLQPDTIPVPSYGPRDVLVRVRMLAVNGWDSRVRRGLAPQLPGRRPIELPILPGREMAGEVVRVGSDVRDLTIGDRVVLSSGPSCGDCEFCFRGDGNLCVRTDYPGHARPGTYAQYIAVPDSWLLRTPVSLTDEQAVSVPWAYANSLRAVSRGRVGLGSTVAVTAASSAMGIASIQLAKLHGARTVIALSRSPRKAEQLLAAGADHVVDYTAHDGLEQIRAIAGAPPFGGVDVVLDNYGGQEMLDLAIGIAAFQARIVMVAWQGEAWDGTVALPGLIVLGKELQIVASRGSLFADQTRVMALAGAGMLSMPVQQTFDLVDIGRAHALLDSGRHVGKILVRT
jgi:NADPH:quinone reductase-like Zn-dependent oxidoreductase